MTPKRRLLTKNAAVILAAAVLGCIGMLMIFARLPRGTVAVVEQNGKELFRQPLLSLEEPVEQEFTGNSGISFTVRFTRDGAEVISAGCPDQVCVRTGKLSHAGETAVCLPAGLSLRMEGGPGADAVAY